MAGVKDPGPWSEPRYERLSSRTTGSVNSSSGLCPASRSAYSRWLTSKLWFTSNLCSRLVNSLIKNAHPRVEFISSVTVTSGASAMFGIRPRTSACF